MRPAPLLAVTALAALCLAADDDGVTPVLDLGAGSGQMDAPGDLYGYTFGTAPEATYDQDHLTLSGEADGTFVTFGYGVGKAGESILTAPLPADGRLRMTAALKDTTADVYEVRVVLLSPDDGDGPRSSAYRFTNQQTLPGTNPAEWSPAPVPTDGQPVVLTATTPLGEPVDTGENGAFDLENDDLAAVQILVQTGHKSGKVTLVVDSIDVGRNG